MVTVSIEELEKHPEAIVERVEAGEMILVTRENVAILKLEPAPPLPDEPSP